MTLQICRRCIYDENTAGIEFDENGVCNYCHMIDGLQALYGTGRQQGHSTLMRILDTIKNAGKHKKYDCVVGVSGGTDSSYMLANAVEWGLRPLAVHYDNTWNTGTATENIRKITSKLNVDLYTYVVDNKESDDIFRSFFLACVPELDGATDIALAETLYRAAAKYDVRYILEGHSFMTEGVSPLGSCYVDGQYIKSIHTEYGRIKMRTFPNMDFMRFMKWIVLKRLKKIRPFWYVGYSKEEARTYLEKKFCWQYYGGHHLENRMTAFNHSVWYPEKFGIDQRNNSLSASVRAGLLRRDEALELYSKPRYVESGLVEYFKKRLDLTDEAYEAVMKGVKRGYRDFRTYKRRFERLRPVFFALAKANLVPMSFYLKYTSKTEMPT